MEQEGETRFKELFENMSSGAAIYSATDDGNDFIITDFNWAGELIERVRKEEVIGNRLTAVFPEASNAGLLDVVQRVWSTSNPEYCLISVTTAEGDIRWRENHVFKLPSGEIVNVYSDVTESRRTEEALRQSEEKWRSITKNAAAIIATVDRDGTVLFVNRTISGADTSQVIGLKVQDYTSPEYSKIISEQIEWVFQTGESVRYEGIGGPEGINSWHEVYFGPVKQDGKIIAVSMIANDITQRKKTEEALKESEEKYRTLIENATTPIAYYDLSGRVIFINTSGAGEVGKTPDEVIGKSIYDILPDIADRAMKLFRKIHESGKGYSFEDSAELASRLHWYMTNIQPIKNAGGEIYAIQVISQDITERKLAEESLRESEAKFRGIAERSFDGIVIIDLEGRITYISPAVERITGYTTGETEGKNFLEFFPEESISRISAAFVDVMQGHTVEMLELETIKKDGTIIPIEANGSPIFSDGNILGAQVIFRDITSHKQAENALKESEEKYRTLIETSNYLPYSVDNVGIILYVGPQVNRYGYVADEVLLRPFFEFVAMEDQDIVISEFTSSMQRGTEFMAQFRMVDKSGNKHWFEDHGSIRRDESGNITGMAGMLRNITERKQSEKVLHESEEKFRIIFENANDEIIYLDKHGTIVDRNMKGEDILGIPFDEVVGKNINEFGFSMPGEQMTGMVEIFDHARKKGEDGRGLTEMGMIHRNGSVIFVEASVSQIRRDDGQKDGLLVILRDITERKHVEEQILQRNRELTALNAIAQTVSQTIDLDDILNNALDKTIEILNIKHGSIAFWDEEGSHLDLKFVRGFDDGQLDVIPQPELENGTFATALQSKESLFIETVSDLISPDQEAAEQLISNQQLKSAVFVPLKARGKTLGVLSFATQNTRIFTTAERDILTTIGHAISTAIENAQLLEAMAQARELEETERLRTAFFASVSHELRTPLTSIKGLSRTLMQPDVEWDKETQNEFLATIDQETDRMVHIINDILDMSKIEAGGMNLEKNMASLESVISAISSTLSNLTAQHELDLLIPKGLPTLPMDEVRIGQVIINLVENAASYSPEGARITIEAESLDDHIIVIVTDKGDGMPSEEIEQAFDLFYRSQRSIKLRRGGSGLGLSICKGIVESHGGVIRVESEVGNGSKFIFTLSINA